MTFWDVSLYFAIGLTVIFVAFSVAGLMGRFHLFELKISAALIVYAAGLLAWLVHECHFGLWQALVRVVGAVLMDSAVLAGVILAIAFIHDRVK